MTDSLDRLYQQVQSVKNADPTVSRTARLLRSGRGKVAKKMAEEAVEVVIDAMNGDRQAVVRESADLLYNLVALPRSFRRSMPTTVPAAKSCCSTRTARASAAEPARWLVIRA
jgi:phosphoribosyl-ATP pyrophosphohydrolase